MAVNIDNIDFDSIELEAPKKEPSRLISASNSTSSMELSKEEKKASADAEAGLTSVALDGIDFGAFAEASDVTKPTMKPLSEAPSNATPEQKASYDQDQIDGAMRGQAVRDSLGIATPTAPSDTDNSLEAGNSDVATYRNTIAPKLEEYRNDYMEAYPKASEEDRETYAEAQVLENEHVTKEWLDTAKSGKSQLTSKQRGKMMDVFMHHFEDGELDSYSSIKDLMVKEGFDAREIDIATLQTPNFKSYAETRADVRAEGYGNTAGVVLGAIDYLADNYSIFKQGNYTDLQKEHAGTLMAYNVIGNLQGAFGKALLDGASYVGLDLSDTEMSRRTKRHQNRDNIMSMASGDGGVLGQASNAAGYGATAGAQVMLPMGALTSFRAAGAISKLAKATAVASLGGAATYGDLKFDQKLSKISDSEVLAWSAGVTALPAVLSLSIAMAKPIAKPIYQGIKNIVGGQEKLAWKYIQNKLTDSELARIEPMIADMKAVGLTEGLTDVQIRMLSATKLRPSLADELANEVKFDSHATKQFLDYYRSVSKATGTPKEISVNATRAFDTLIADTKELAKQTKEARKQNIDSTGLTADAISVPPNFATDVASLGPSVPAEVLSSVKRIVSGDRGDLITIKMLQDTMDKLAKYGSDTQNFGAKATARTLKSTQEDMLIANGIDLQEAADVIKASKAAEASEKLIKKLFETNTFGKMFKAASAKGKWNLDVVLSPKLDVGSTSKELTEFLDALPVANRGNFENVIVDTFAQAFDRNTQAAKTLGVADMGDMSNSIQVFKETIIESPAALQKLDLLETFGRVSEHDSIIAKAILNGPAGDAEVAKQFSDGIGFGLQIRAIKTTLDALSGRVIEGAAYRRQLSKLLNDMHYAPKATTWQGAMDQQDNLLNHLYKVLSPLESRVAPKVSSSKIVMRPAGSVTPKPSGVKQLITSLKDRVNYRNQVVNTMFFKKHEGQVLDADYTKALANAIDSGDVRIGNGDILPTPGAKGMMVAVGSQLKFKSTHKLAEAMRSGGEVMLSDVLPLKANTSFYNNFPEASKLRIRPYSAGTDADVGGSFEQGGAMIEANVGNAKSGNAQFDNTMNIDLNGNNIRRDISNILHETQHYLADKQGLPRGGTVEQMALIRNTLPPSIYKIAHSNKLSIEQAAYTSLGGEQMSQVAEGARTIVGADGKRYASINYGSEVDGKYIVKGKKLARGGLSQQHREAGGVASDSKMASSSVDAGAIEAIEASTARLRDGNYMSLEENKAIVDLIPKVYGPPKVAVVRPSTWNNDEGAMKIIRDYTSAFTEEDSSNHWYEISKAQRAGKKTELDTKLFDKHEPNYSGTSYTGTRVAHSQIEMFDGLKNGDVLTNKAFIATSTSTAKPTERFMHPPWLANSHIRKPMFIEIEGKGYDISGASSIKGEEEVLYAPGRHFEIIDNRVVGDIRLLKLKEVDASTTKGKPKIADMLGFTGVAAAGATSTDKPKDN